MFTGRKWLRSGLIRLMAACLIFLWVLNINLPVQARFKPKCQNCSQTARAMWKADVSAAWDEYWIAVGNSFNLTDWEESKEALQEAQEELKENMDLAGERKEARLEICEKIGECPYDPQIDPEEFVDFDLVVSGQQNFVPNPYFPLVPGTAWEYLGFDENDVLVERILVEVLEETEEILGVRCIVVRDRVWEIDEEDNEILVEDTLDWYAQDLDGNTWYFGELSQEFEDGELVSLAGSWKAGRDGAKPGIIMPADPQPGDVYRQEFFLGEAEDMAEVISRGVAVITVLFGLYNVDVLENQEWTPIEPDGLELKYYAPGVGLILELNPESGDRAELNDMTVAFPE
jgi:hypothetical protein